MVLGSISSLAAWLNSWALWPNLPIWSYALITLIDTHITTTCVTLYLHRCQTHRSITFNPMVEHFMRFWLWVRTAMPTREWVAVHRCHHANVDTDKDPHSPIVYGIPDVLGADRARYAGRRVMVVGSGHSAFNALIELGKLAAEAPETRVTWAIRRSDLRQLFGGESADMLPARGALGTAIRSMVDAGALSLVTGFRVARLERTDDGIVVSSLDRDLEPVDEIIGATGFRPDLSLFTELRVDLDPVGDEQGRHDVTVRRMVTTIQMKRGVPSAVVTTPTGMVRPAGARRISRSAASSRMAPIAAAGTRARPGWPPDSRRATNGAIRPTNPMAPQTDTQAPTAIALSATTSTESRLG